MRPLSMRAPGFVSTVVLCEIIWVLEELYGVERERLVDIIDGLLASRQLVVDDAEAVRAALKRRQCGLADAIIHEIGQARRCDRTVTFDRKFARLENVELLGG